MYYCSPRIMSCLCLCFPIGEFGKMSTEEQKAEIREWKSKRKEIMPVFLANVAISLVLTVGILFGGYYYCDCIPVPESNDLGVKLLYTLRWCAFPFAVLLYFMIFQVGNKRGSSPAANPLAGKEDFVQPEKNILVNTMEQIVMAVLILLALTTYLTPLEMKLVPLYVLQFLVGRVLFNVGYKIHPKYRSAGVVMSFAANFFFLCLIGYFVYSRGLMAGVPTITIVRPQADAGRSDL